MLLDVTDTRGSVLADAALGVTIPLTSRWHIEPLIRGGYPHIWGASITAGYKFPLPQNTSRIIETIRTTPPNEIIKMISIYAIEFILFGPDIGSYNVGIDRDAQQLNELVLNYTAQTLLENPSYRVRLEGHVNPYTYARYEIEDLMALSAMRADTIAEQLRARGVSDEQMIIASFGGTRTATSDWDIRNRNRRVEIMIIAFDPN
jgi:outer membrane protein OmpA-like peptidoglycan-associated protein